MGNNCQTIQSKWEPIQKSKTGGALLSSFLAGTFAQSRQLKQMILNNLNSTNLKNISFTISKCRTK